MTMAYENVKNHMEQGGAQWDIEGALDIESGGYLNANSGGMVNFKSGSIVTLAGTNNVSGTLKIGGTTVSPTAAQLNAAPIRIISYEVEDLDADGDIANRPIFIVPSGYKITLSDILVLSQGTVANVDNDNTAVIDVKNGTDSIASKTFNASVSFPAIATATNLGSLSTTYKELDAGDVVRLSVTCGTSANLPAFVIEAIGTIETA